MVLGDGMSPVYHRIEPRICTNLHESARICTNLHESNHMTPKQRFALAFFAAFRLAYAPVVGLFHTAHGLPWLIAGLILLFSFGGEWGRRRVNTGSPSKQLSASPERGRRATILVILALILLGFTPEEGLVGLILWAAMGLAWVDLLPGPAILGRLGWIEALGWLAGIGVGLLGILGPAPWLAAAVIGGMLWRKNGPRI